MTVGDIIEKSLENVYANVYINGKLICFSDINRIKKLVYIGDERFKKCGLSDMWWIV